MQDDPTTPLNHEGSASAEMPPVSQAWGSFRLLARVGHGSFGEVYRAWDPHLEREVAVKLLLPASVGDEEDYQAILREARALAAVQHPNIVHVYGMDRHDGRVGYWTDFVHGKTLSFLVLAQGPFGYREAALIGLDVAKALSAGHRAGLLHRDIHAVGLLLLYLGTGQHPGRLGGLTAKEAAAAISKRKALIDLRPDLSESFMRTVSVAMEMDPAKRYASAGQLAEALAESLGAPVAAGTVSAPKAASKTTLWVTIAALLLLAVAGSALWLAGI